MVRGAKLDGRPVRVANTREQDMVSSPGAPGLEATVKMGARKDGTITAARVEFDFDSGGWRQRPAAQPSEPTISAKDAFIASRSASDTRRSADQQMRLSSDDLTALKKKLQSINQS